jgi:hypothetical protein
MATHPVRIGLPRHFDDGTWLNKYGMRLETRPIDFEAASIIIFSTLWVMLLRPCCGLLRR